MCTERTALTCDGCQAGTAWLKKVQDEGHDDPATAFLARFTTTSGRQAGKYLKEYCPGKQILEGQEKPKAT